MSDEIQPMETQDDRVQPVEVQNVVVRSPRGYRLKGLCQVLLDAQFRSSDNAFHLVLIFRSIHDECYTQVALSGNALLLGLPEYAEKARTDLLDELSTKQVLEIFISSLSNPAARTPVELFCNGAKAFMCRSGRRKGVPDSMHPRVADLLPFFVRA